MSASAPRALELSRRALLLSAATGLGLPGVAHGDEADDAPRRGGTLRLGLGGGSTTDSLEPGRWNDSVMIATGFALYNNLVENGPDNRPIPELAERFEPRDGARTWTFTLRPDITFHTGKTFEADDAIYSLNLHRGPSTSAAAGLMAAVTAIRKTGRLTFEVTLSAPDADFPVLLTDYHYKMVPDGFSDWDRPVGTGAFVLERFEPGVRVALTRPGPYWKTRRGWLDRVEITVLNDTAARMNALIAGQVDAINRADPKTVSRIDKSPTFAVVRAAGGWFPTMAMMLDRPPYGSPDLRLALKYALDREQMIKLLFSGYATLGNDHPVPPGDPFFNTELPQTPFDPDKAAFFFRKAGLTSPSILLQTSDAAFNGAVRMAELFQASAKGAGIPVAVRQEAADDYFNKVWLEGAFVASYWGGRPSATQMMHVAYASGAPWNETHLRDPAFDGLLAQARGEVDPTRRKAFLWDMQAVIAKGGGSLIPCFRDWLDARNRRVGGHTPHSGLDMDNGRIAEKAFLTG